MSLEACVQRNHDEINSPEDPFPLPRAHVGESPVFWLLREHIRVTGSFQCGQTVVSDSIQVGMTHDGCPDFDRNRLYDAKIIVYLPLPTLLQIYCETRPCLKCRSRSTRSPSMLTQLQVHNRFITLALHESTPCHTVHIPICTCTIVHAS